jgi:hypothetical protein
LIYRAEFREFGILGRNERGVSKGRWEISAAEKFNPLKTLHFMDSK